MGDRKILDVSFGLIVTAIGAYLLFPRFRNDWSCESSVPSNSAQSVALNDAQLRKEDVCSGSQHRCVFGVYVNADGTIQVSLYLAEKDFFAGCISKGQDLDVFVYSREGRFLRTDEAPFS